MRIDIITCLPELAEAALEHSIVKRARDRGIVDIRVISLRDFTEDRHRTTDDIPYGGGGGMIMKIEPIDRALQALTAVAPLQEDLRSEVAAADTVDLKRTPNDAVDDGKARSVPSARIVLTDPRGRQFTQGIAEEWSREEHLILICGHYEGVDDRVRQHLVTDEISVGDYILTGGELPALMIVDALTRLQPGALGDEEAPQKDTFSDALLEYPHYTRPREYRGWKVPDILFSGHHARIEEWRLWHRLQATRERRPDLFARVPLTAQSRRLLESSEPVAPPLKDKEADRQRSRALTDPAMIICKSGSSCAADTEEE